MYLYIFVFREEWVAAIRGVADRLAEMGDVDMPSESSNINSSRVLGANSRMLEAAADHHQHHHQSSSSVNADEFNAKFSRLGTANTSSGKKKVVCYI